MQRLVSFALVSSLFAFSASRADAECRCLSVAGEIGGALQADIAKADGLYARGDYRAALAIYMQAQASAKTPELIYAQAMAQWQIGAKAEARALFEKYLGVSGSLAFRARAEAAVDELKKEGVVAGVVGGTTGVVGGLTGNVVGNVTGETAGAVGVVGGVTGDVRGRIEGKAKPPKLAHGAAVVLGVVAVAAIGMVGIHSIAAGVKDDIELDPKFDLGLGLTGVTVGITAIYLNGLTAATAAAGSVRCAELPKGKPIVAPVAMHGGGGLAAAMSF